MTVTGTRDRFTGPNLLIGIGMLPLALLALLIGVQSQYSADVGLLFLGLLLALASYAALLVAWIIGLIWVLRLVRQLGTRPPFATNAWIVVAAIALATPWVFFASR